MSSTSHGVRLLDVDADYGAELPPGELAEARQQVVLPAVRLDKGSWALDQLREGRGVRGEPRGFMVVDGTVSIDLAIAGQVCTRLITTRELVLLDSWQEESIPARAGWSVLESATLAVLDDRLSIIAARYPALLSAILRRAAQQLRQSLLQQAISQLPRVEDRLLALLWSIADRQGIVRRDGVWVRLPVTHATLAQMIGARRPTVSLGLRALTDRGLLKAENGGWLVSPDSLDAFSRPDLTTDAVGD